MKRKACFKLEQILCSIILTSGFCGLLVSITCQWHRFVKNISFSAMLHTGLGPYQVSSFISTLKIPSINPKNLKEREREVGKNIEECARTSCEQALKEELSNLR